MENGPDCPTRRLWGSLDPFVEGGGALGRRVANSTFLEALFDADPYDGYHFFLENDASCEQLLAWTGERFPGLLERGAVLVRPRASLQAALASTPYHCMHLSDALTHYSRLAQTRNAFACSLFPITGLTHSLSYARFMPAYLQHLWAGVSPRDAILVTSESARSVLERVFTGIRESYALDTGAFPAPELVHLPLGVDFAALPTAEDRWDASPGASGSEAPEGLRMRTALEIGREVLFLCLSRFCPHSKMDLLPLFAAFRRAFALGLPRDGHVLVLAGWAEEGDALPEALGEYARGLGITVRLALRPTDAERRALYAAADVFVSPSDNIQETFGLTLAEAAGAGLPVIASDFDGYRDIVADGENGMLVPTLGFADSAETDVQSLFWFDNQYHLKLAQETALDVPELARALALLGTNAPLRASMGQRGRLRSRERFAWPVVIRRLVEIWDALAATPLSPEREAALRGAVHPLRMRFAKSFAGHFTRTLCGEGLHSFFLRRTPSGDALYRGALPLVHYAGMDRILDPEGVRLLLVAARKPKSAETLLRGLEAFFSVGPSRSFARERAAQTLLWCLKHDYLEKTDPVESHGGTSR